ncbi:MAG: protein kinase domain-containing protein [Planctomycetota bacterium]
MSDELEPSSGAREPAPTPVPAGGDDTAFAELLEDLFEQLLDGDDVDRSTLAERHPAVAHRLDEAVALAVGSAGRRARPRPSLQGYEIVRELGRGGMGTVYLARHAELDRDVALKVLPHSFGVSQQSRQRFLHEARALARIDHPHVVAIHRIVDRGEVLAFEMDYVDGPSLQQLLDHLRQHAQRSGAPASIATIAEGLGLEPQALGARHPTQFFVRLVTKIAQALGEVHGRGLVHRDVKPANILLRKNGEPVLVDFGLARPSGVHLSRRGEFAGTPVYSAPEQLRGDAEQGAAADVYGLGVTLYECLTLRTPFQGGGTAELLRAIHAGRHAPLRRWLPSAPRDLETIVAHALEVEAEHRYPHCGALADDLQRLQDLQPIRARRASWLRRGSAFVRRQRAPLLAAVAGAALVVGALVPWLQRERAAVQRRELAQRHVVQAQQQLLSVGNWPGSAHGGAAPGGMSDSGAAVVRAAPAATAEAVLATAAADYDAARDLVPDDAGIARERAVVHLAAWLRQLAVGEQQDLARAVDGGEFERRTRDLGPALRRVARHYALGTLDDGADPFAGLTTSSVDERLAIGLLGFLVGDFDTCERALAVPATAGAVPSWVDGALGLVHCRDGMPALAYVHLSQAQRRFPSSPTLAFALAESALALGDLGLARQWLATVPATADDLRRQRLELDLRAAAGGDDAALAVDYERLAAADPGDPVPRHRLAVLAWRRGDARAAAAQLDQLLAAWPQVARFRLDRARLALQRRDLGGYLQQALAVLVDDCGRGRSRGTRADLLEVLRLGGLHSLHAAAVAEGGGERSGRSGLGDELPIRAFVPAWLAARCEWLLPQIAAARQRTRAGLVAVPLLRDEIAPSVWTALHAAASVPLPDAGDLWRRLLAGAAADALPQAYPLLAPLSWRLGLWLSGRDWVPVQLRSAGPPPELAAEHLFGNAVVVVDDQDGDGARDVLAAAVAAAGPELRGRVVVLDGRTLAVQRQLVGGSERHIFGYALAQIADLDGDGRRDFVVGAPAGTKDAGSGQVELWSARRGERLATIAGDGPAFGVSVAAVDDVDGDGVDDFAVGEAPILRNAAAQGRVVVLSGRTRERLRVLANDVPGVWFGAAIAAVGDVDGDGCGELAVGGNFGGAPGLVRLVSLRRGTELRRFGDDDPAHGFGTAVLGLPDVDGDGAADLAIAAVRGEGAGDCDEVLVLSGRSGDRLATIRAPRPGTRFGQALAVYVAAGPDTVLAVGVPAGGASAAGGLEFVSVRGVLLSTLQGPIPLGQFATAFGVGGDVDGDGRPDLYVGGPLTDGNGRVFCVESSLVRWPTRK